MASGVWMVTNAKGDCRKELKPKDLKKGSFRKMEGAGQTSWNGKER